MFKKIVVSALIVTSFCHNVQASDVLQALEDQRTFTDETQEMMSHHASNMNSRRAQANRYEKHDYKPCETDWDLHRLESDYQSDFKKGSTRSLVTQLMLSKTIEQKNKLCGIVLDKQVKDQNLLHAAASTGDDILADLVIHLKPEFVNQKDACGIAPLHYAAMAGNATITELLLQNHAEVNLLDNENNTALHFALAIPHFDVAIQLLAHNISFDKINDSGLTAADVALQAFKENLNQSYDPVFHKLYLGQHVKEVKSTLQKAIAVYESAKRCREKMAYLNQLFPALEYQIPFNTITNEHGDNALEVAIKNNDHALIAIAQQAGMQPKQAVGCTCVIS